MNLANCFCILKNVACMPHCCPKYHRVNCKFQLKSLQQIIRMLHRDHYTDYSALQMLKYYVNQNMHFRLDGISKKDFCPGRMATSEWRHSVRAARDTPVLYYSAPGVNSTCRYPYHPQMGVSPFLLDLSVSYLKGSLWHCSQW